MGCGAPSEGGHSLNLCLAKVTKQRAREQVEVTEQRFTRRGAVTVSIDIKIPSWQQDLREDDLPYQHAPFPDSACLGNNGSDCSCTRGVGGCQGAEFASSSTSMVQRIVGESALASDSQNSLGLTKVGHMSIPPRFP